MIFLYTQLQALLTVITVDSLIVGRILVIFLFICMSCNEEEVMYRHTSAMMTAIFCVICTPL